MLTYELCSHITKFFHLNDLCGFQSLHHSALAANHKLKLTHVPSSDLEEETKLKVKHYFIVSGRV